MTSCNAIFIVGAKRTPFCKYGGSLRDVMSSKVFAAAANEAISTAGVDPKLIDSTIVGNINYLSQCDGGKTPRYCGLYSGVPIERPALGVNRGCGTGVQAIINGSLDIMTGLANMTLVGGTEVMSALPLLVRNARFGTKLGEAYKVEDYLLAKDIPDTYTGLSQLEIAENTAKAFKITREEADNFTAESHSKLKQAKNSNAFASEITPVTMLIRKKEVTIESDEISFEADTDSLRVMPPSVKGGHVVTTGNTSLPADGAAAIILANEETVNGLSLRPLARISAWSCVGANPMEFGSAAIKAVKQLIDNTKLRIQDVDLFEINETFAVEVLACAKDLKLDGEKLNVSGGSLALGHPVSATGARMVTHLVHQLRARNLKTAIAASSCGGGQGVAMLIENM